MLMKLKATDIVTDLEERNKVSYSVLMLHIVKPVDGNLNCSVLNRMSQVIVRTSFGSPLFRRSSQYSVDVSEAIFSLERRICQFLTSYESRAPVLATRSRIRR